MKNLSHEQQQELRRMFGSWVSFDKEERRIYSHDVGALPKLIKPFVGAATAAAVVQPETEEQLVELVHWANRHRIHLVPRAKATSGYGGVMPVKGGVTVNMTRMSRVLAVDPQAMTACVESGLVWRKLEAVLEAADLALRNYPSSAPSSTVGGWLAQGGVGYGSYEFGYFRDNVVSARVVLPDGSIRTFEDDELDYISDAEGITGFVTQVTIRLRERHPERVRAIVFPSAQQLSAAVNELLAKRVPLWSVSFVNPQMARLKNQVPPKLLHGEPTEKQESHLPESGYTLLLNAPQERWSAIESALESIVVAHHGEPLAPEVAAHEWEQRFNLMNIKRLGPSLLPAEAIVPAEKLGVVLEDLDKSVKQPLTLEGMLHVGSGGAARGEVTLLGFIPHDERKLSFGVAYSLSLTFVKTAKKHGGRAYSTGLYFSSQAEQVLGSERVVKLRDFKRRVDAKRIMNPRKVVDKGLMGYLLGAVLPFEPLARVPANLMRSPVGERVDGQGRRDVPDDMAWYAYACAQCGYCVDSCTQYYGRGWESESPRGKWFFLRDYMEGKAEMTQAWVDNFMACTTCELCDAQCPLNLPIEHTWLKMRGELVDKSDRLPFPPFKMMRAAAKKECNIWGAYSENRADWIPEDVKPKILPKSEIAYFAGCTASFVEQDVAQGTTKLLTEAGVDFTYLGEEEACCGIPILCSGHWDTFEGILRHNVESMQARGVKTVVTSCPACWLAWSRYYPKWAKKLGIPYDIETRHYTELLSDRIASGDLKFTHEVSRKVTWHDSCHMGRAGGIYEPPRQLLKAIPGVELTEMAYNRENAHCCGSVLTLLKSPDGAALNIGARRIQEAEETGADALVAACPCCEVQLRVSAQKLGSSLPVVDLAHVAAEGLGVELPDPTEFALEQWATFEAMIKLLKPEAMASFMEPLLPSMIEAMPRPLAGIMRWTRRTSPGTRAVMLGLMRPMMPSLFPTLLPGMMPRMMPEMLEAMEKVVPMPEHLKEQMPDLMPQVMEDLMPKMLPEVLPHLLPKVEAYLNAVPEAA